MKKVFSKEEKERISKIYSSMVSLESDISYAKIISHMNYGNCCIWQCSSMTSTWH